MKKRLLEQSSLFNKAVNIFVALMLTAFPLYSASKYFNIENDKYLFFCITTSLISLFILSYFIIDLIKSKKFNLLSNFKPFSAVDYSILLFYSVSLMSTILSDYQLESITGQLGRHTGLIFLTMCVLAYFWISRYYDHKQSIILMFIITSCAICLLAILNYVNIDPLGYLENVYCKRAFISTIGNINFFSSFVCLILPLSIMLYMLCKDKVSKIIYLTSCIFGFCGLIVGNSESGFFAIGAFLIILFVYSLYNKNLFKLYLIILLSFIMSAKFIYIISEIFKGQVRKLSSIPSLLVYSNISNLFLIAIAAILILTSLNKKSIDVKKIIIIRKIILSTIIACILIILLLFIYFSFINKNFSLGVFETYLRFNDDWGTQRGYTWIRCLQLFASMNFKSMLFGIGPDTLAPVIYDYCGDETNIIFEGTYIDSAHNEYIQYLLTLGIFGLCAYLFLVFTLIKKIIKYRNTEPLILIFGASIFCYLIQAFVNIAQPITTPLLFIFIGMFESVYKNLKTNKV